MPVLFLQPPPLEAGSSLAGMYLEDGFTAIYAYPVQGTDTEAALGLADAVEWLMTTQHPQWQRLVMVGCVTGGVLGRRYLMLSGYERVAYLFTVGSSHRYSPLAYLRGTIFEPRDGSDEPPPVAAPALDDTVMLNIYSEGLGAGAAQAEHGVHLPEAINVGLPLGPEALCRDVLTYRAMRRHLQGQFWLVTVRLKSLVMQGAQEQERTGPFCFEVNGWRAPFDGAFRVPVGVLYEFDPARTLLGTVTFPLTEMGRAVDIDFRLKDLSPVSGRRRKLSTSLHTPLRDDLVSEHVLQDSLGSEVGIQVCCQRPRSVLEADHD